MSEIISAPSGNGDRRTEEADVRAERAARFPASTIVELCRIRRAGHCVGGLPSYCYYGLLLSRFCWPGNGNCHNPSHSAWRDQPPHERGVGGQHLHAVATAAC